MLDHIAYQPPALYRPGEITISPWSYQSIGVDLVCAGQRSLASQNYIAANVVIFVPFVVVEPMLVTRLWWANGAAVSGNIDCGIYNESAALLASTGSSGQTPINVVQSVDIADIALARGRYYMAMVSDTSGATQKVMAALPAAGIPQSLGLLEQASVTLPLATHASPATFAIYTRAFVPLFGLQGYRAIAL